MSKQFIPYPYQQYCINILGTVSGYGTWKDGYYADGATQS